jgi:transposase
LHEVSAGGGLTAERQAFREHIRLQAAELFAAGQGNSAVARELRVSVRSVQRWRRTWEDGGERALASNGPASRPKLSEALFAVLEQELVKGPVAHGWPDQTWTLARIKTLIGRRFHKSMTLSAIAQMLHRHGFSHQVPARHAVERNQEAVTGWVKETWPQVETPRRRSGLDLLRRRGRLLDDAAHDTDLGQARAHARHPGAGTLTAPVLHRRSDLLQAGRTLAPDLQAQAACRPQTGRQTQFHLDRVPRPADRRPPAARRPDRAHLGQLERAQGRSAAGVHRLPRLDQLPFPAGLRASPQPGRRHLVTAATQQPGQHRVHRPRPLDAHPQTGPPPDPVPQQRH